MSTLSKLLVGASIGQALCFVSFLITEHYRYAFASLLMVAWGLWEADNFKNLKWKETSK